MKIVNIYCIELILSTGRIDFANDRLNIILNIIIQNNLQVYYWNNQCDATIRQHLLRQCGLHPRTCMRTTPLVRDNRIRVRFSLPPRFLSTLSLGLHAVWARLWGKNLASDVSVRERLGEGCGGRCVYNIWKATAPTAILVGNRSITPGRGRCCLL